MRDKTHYNNSDDLFKIILFENNNHKIPFIEYFAKQSKHKQTVISKYIDLLETKGNKIRMPYSKKVDDNIYELRIINYGYNVRVMYFYTKDREIIITNAFDKKTNKTPIKQIVLANTYRKIWLSKGEKNGI